MILLSMLGLTVLFGLFLWQLTLKFKRSWMFRIGERLHFLLPTRSFIGNQLPWFTSLLGCMMLSLLVVQKGMATLGTSIITFAIWMMNIVCALALYTRMAIIRPDSITVPFRFNKAFDGIQAVELQENSINFKLATRAWTMEIPSLRQRNEARTVMAFMESLKSTASLQGVQVSEWSHA